MEGIFHQWIDAYTNQLLLLINLRKISSILFLLILYLDVKRVFPDPT